MISAYSSGNQSNHALNLFSDDWSARHMGGQLHARHRHEESTIAEKRQGCVVPTVDVYILV